METRLKENDPKAKFNLLYGPLSNLYMIDCTMNKGHRAGGLAILWNDVLKVDILNSNKMFIGLYITACNLNISWYSTGFYGYPYTSKKHLTCQAIRDINQTRIDSNWLIFGDFNLMLNSSEKLGGNIVGFHLTKLFNDTLNGCDLTDLGYYGDKYTWANNQIDHIHIKEIIDRFCATSNWICTFPKYINKHLLRYSSDHNPILLEFSEDSHNRANLHKPKIQRFEHIWAQDQESYQIVKEAWEHNNDNSLMKLDFTLSQIAKWGKAKYGHIPNKIKEHQDLLCKLKNDIPTSNSILKIKETEKMLDDLKHEEVWWA